MSMTDHLREQIRRRLAAGESPKQIAEALGLKVMTRFRLEKFDGEMQPGDQPVEVIEGGDDMPTTITHPKETNDGT